MQCILPQSQTTPERTLSNPWFGKGFCEPNQYKAAIDRCEGGYRSCELGIDMFGGLIKILNSCSENIRQWSIASQKQINQSKESNTTKQAWRETVRAVEKLADRDNQLSQNIQKMVIDKMNSYKSENYGKSFIHVKKIKEFEKEFKKAQKPWVELIDQINDAKETYLTMKRKLQQAQAAERVVESDVGSTEEQKNKASSSVAIRKNETEKCRKKYENLISEMEKMKPTYQTQMFKTLEDTDNFERKRLNHFNSMFDALRLAIITDKDKSHNDMVDALEKAFAAHSIEADINYFNKNYGKETKTNWPVFEDFKG